MLKHCKVCGAEYDSCYSCEKKHSWRTLTDTAEHYYILGVLMEYQGGHDAKKAYQALHKRNVDFRDTGRFLPSVQKLMAEINALAHENSRAKKSTVSKGLKVKEDVKDSQVPETVAENE